MIVSCPSCEARYKYDETRFGESATKKLKCSKCATIFEVQRPEQADEPNTQVGRPKAPEETTKELEIKEMKKLEEPEDATLPPIPPSRRFSLAVILGANAGTIFPVPKPRVVLGRGAESDIQLQDSEVSRRHAKLEIRGEYGTITDLGSTNGVFVGGQRVEKTRIEPHQEFSLGTTTLMFIMTESQESVLP